MHTWLTCTFSRKVKVGKKKKIWWKIYSLGSKKETPQTVQLELGGLLEGQCFSSWQNPAHLSRPSLVDTSSRTHSLSYLRQSFSFFLPHVLIAFWLQLFVGIYQMLPCSKVLLPNTEAVYSQRKQTSFYLSLHQPPLCSAWHKGGTQSLFTELNLK